MICVEILPPKAKSHLVVVWYRPPSDRVESFNKLELLPSFLDKEESNLFDAKHLTNIYELFTFKQLSTEPIHVTANSSYIICNNIAKAGVIWISLRDHVMVFCVRKFVGGALKDHKTIKTWRMNNFNEQMFLTDVASIN